MTALQGATPIQRTVEIPSPSPSPEAARSAEVLDLLRAAEALGGEVDRPCQGTGRCERPGTLTLVTEEGTSDLCGLHALTVVFSTTIGPLVLVKPGE